MAKLIAIFAICICFVYHVNGSLDTISKSVALTPSTTVQDGVQIYNLGVETADDNQLGFTISSIEGMYLHITMDDTWKLMSNEVSTITLTTYTNIANTQNDLIFSFSQNNDRYLSTLIEMDDPSSNHIYPLCDIASSQSLANGDIGSTLNTIQTNETYGATNDQEYELLQGNGFETLPSSVNPDGVTNEITLSITNNPMDESSKFAYDGAMEQCSFESWDIDHPLDIYISGANINNTLTIEKIELVFTYSTDQMEGQAEGAADDEDSASNGDTNDNPTTSKPALIHDNQLDSQIEGYNTKSIVAVLIGITVCLFIVCITLVILVRKQSIENKKDLIQSAFQQNKAMQKEHDLAKMIKVPTNTITMASYQDDNTIQGGHIRGESDIDDQIIQISILNQNRSMSTNLNGFNFNDYNPNIDSNNSNDRVGPILMELTEMKQQDHVKDMRPNASYPRFNVSRQNSWSITAESASNDFEINLGNLVLGNEIIMEDVVEQMHVTPHPMKIPPTAPIVIPPTAISKSSNDNDIDDYGSKNEVDTPCGAATDFELGRQASELPYDQDVDNIDPYEDDEEAIADMVETLGNL